MLWQTLVHPNEQVPSAGRASKTKIAKDFEDLSHIKDSELL